MKVLMLTIFSLALSALEPAMAETVYVCGDVSGVWSADTVWVTCEVHVPTGETLTIQPGVKVLFWTYCKFVVDSDAVLNAVGTPGDTILFDERAYSPERHENRWNGIRFLSASSSSRLEYCHLKHGLAIGGDEDAKGGAIYCSSSSPVIRNCLIDSCTAGNSGGGIYCIDSSPVIDSNTFQGDSAYFGAGIYCQHSSPVISSNTISGNFALYGGGSGIYCDSTSVPAIRGNTISGNSANVGGGIYCDPLSTPVISDNTLSGNSASYGGGIYCAYYSTPTIGGNTISGCSAGYGGGIYCDYLSAPIISGNIITGNSAYDGGGIRCANSSSVDISGNTISRNAAYGYGGGISCESNSNPIISGNTISEDSAYFGGGIYCENSSPTIDRNQISQNTASGDGGGIYLNSSNPTMNKNTIVRNLATTGGGIFATYSSPVLTNCILWGNSPGQQIRQVYASNVLVTYSDLLSFWPGVGNIFDYPSFVDSANGDYHLRAGSPCIDTGDPDPASNDSDGTRADMGCYNYQGSLTPPVLLALWGENGMTLAWRPLVSAVSYDVYYSTRISGDPWYLLTSTPDTTITDPIGGDIKRFYCVTAVR